LLKKVSRNTHVERVKAVLDTREFRKEEIQRNFIWFDYYVNKDRMTDETLFGAVLNMYLMVYEGRSKISIMGMVLRDIVIDAIHYGGKISVLPAIAGRTTRGLLKRLRRIV
jgi:hypothetical protein